MGRIVTSLRQPLTEAIGVAVEHQYLTTRFDTADRLLVMLADLQAEG